MKFNINDLQNVLAFDPADFEGVYYQDDKNDFYAVDYEEYQWLVALDEAIDYLVENDLLDNFKAIEYQDYIDQALADMGD